MELSIRRARNWEEVDRAAVVTASAFDARPDRGDIAPERFRARMVDVPGLSLDNVLVGYVDDELVCGLQLYDRWTTIDGHRLPFAGVGNVMVAPDHQGQGYGSRLLERAVAVIEDRGYPLSILRGNRSLYRRHGWERIHATRTVADTPGTVRRDGPADHADAEWVPYGGRLEELCGVHRHTVRQTAANVWRTRPVWEDWVFELDFADPEDVVLYERDGGIEGYLVAGEDGGVPVCRELGHVYADADERDAFLAACWNRLAGGSELVWRPPRLPPGAAGASDGLARERASAASIRACRPELLSAVTGTAITDSRDLLTHVQSGPWYWPGLDGF